MKKKFLLVIIFFVFVTATGFILFSRNNKGEKQTLFSELLPRNNALSQAKEWENIKTGVVALKQKISKDPRDIKSLLALCSFYLQEARATGNLAYYNEAAVKCAEAVLQIEKDNFEALTFKAMILLSRHRFDEGLVIAQQAQKINPYNAFVYGLLVDAHVEKGNYAAALENADKMISIRPDARSYSRIAYLREIHGDIPGAIDAMKMAVDAGIPGDENTEWCRIQLGKLYEQIGKIREAKMHYTIASDNRPGYPYAIAGLAGIAAEEKDYPKAISLYQQADAALPDHTFKEGLAELYSLTGQEEKAKMLADEILSYMKNNSGESGNGQNEDHEMAHAYMGKENYIKALEYALREYKRRPANIEVNETVAIVYYHMGEYEKAMPFIETALKTDCQNPELLCQAGLIYAKSGDKVKAKTLLQNALKNNPVINRELKEESINVLRLLSP